MTHHRFLPCRLAGLALCLALCLALPFAGAASGQATRAAAPGDLLDPAAEAPPGTRRVEHASMRGPGFDVAPGIDDDGTFMIYDVTRVAANGVSLRQCTSGSINLVGMPDGSQVVRAFLYWQWISLPAPVAGLQDTMLFAQMPLAVPVRGGGFAFPLHVRPRKVTGTLVGSGADPCWLGGGNFVYRADVTKLVRSGATYTVWLPAGAYPAADWNDPFTQLPPPPGPYCQGASLVVVYRNLIENMGTTIVYDAGLAGTMFMGTPGLSWNLTGFVAPGNESRWINIGGDGQTGGGYGDVQGPGLEVTVFQATASLAGGGAGIFPYSFYNDSDWNGSANKPLGQLWDTSGHEISAYFPAGTTSANVAVFEPTASPLSDCLVPVANVLWMR